MGVLFRNWNSASATDSTGTTNECIVRRVTALAATSDDGRRVPNINDVGASVSVADFGLAASDVGIIGRLRTRFGAAAAAIAAAVNSCNYCCSGGAKQWHRRRPASAARTSDFSPSANVVSHNK